MTAIVVESLVKRYGGFTAVRDVSFTAPAGEVTALLGPNGAGKTTTIEILEGFQAPTAGTVRVLGTDPRARGPRARPGEPGSAWSCSPPAWTNSSPSPRR
jgi:ABC-2 type transport system ATP-binding protein